MATMREQLSADAQRKVLLRRVEKLKDHPAVLKVASKYGGWQGPQAADRFDRTQPSATFKTGVGAPAVQDMPVQIEAPVSNIDQINRDRDAIYERQVALSKAMNAKYNDGGTESRIKAAPAAGTATTLDSLEAKKKSTAKIAAAELAHKNALGLYEKMQESDPSGLNPKTESAKLAALKAEINLANLKELHAETPAASAAVTATPSTSRVMEGMGEGGTPLLTNRSEDDLYTAMENKFGSAAQTRRVAPSAASAVETSASTGAIEAPLSVSHEQKFGGTPAVVPTLGAQDRPMASATQKVVNGATYQKVAGGWQLVSK